MPKRIWQDRTMRTFLLVTLLLGIGLQLMYFVDGSPRWWKLAMWAPAVGVLAMGRPGLVVLSTLWRFEMSWVAIGIFLGVMPHFLSQFMVALFGLGDWNAWHTIPHRLFLGNEEQSTGFLGLNLLLTLFFSGMVATFASGLGQEIGWRGYLQPHLVAKYGNVIGTAVVGVIWAYWSLPTSAGQLLSAQEFVLIGLIMAPIGIFSLSFVLAWLRAKSHAIWPCAFLVGFFFASENFFLIRPSSMIVHVATQTISLVVMGGFFYWLSARDVSAETRRAEAGFADPVTV